MTDSVVFIKPEYGACKPDDGGFKLKLCPFCGSKPNLEQDCDSTWYVECVNKRCFVLPLTRPYETRRQAVIAWNNRVEN